jgi:hypothetical protein
MKITILLRVENAVAAVALHLGLNNHPPAASRNLGIRRKRMEQHLPLSNVVLLHHLNLAQIFHRRWTSILNPPTILVWM